MSSNLSKGLVFRDEEIYLASCLIVTHPICSSDSLNGESIIATLNSVRARLSEGKRTDLHSMCRKHMTAIVGPALSKHRASYMFPSASAPYMLPVSSNELKAACARLQNSAATRELCINLVSGDTFRQVLHLYNQLVAEFA